MQPLRKPISGYENRAVTHCYETVTAISLKPEPVHTIFRHYHSINDDSLTPRSLSEHNMCARTIMCIYVGSVQTIPKSRGRPSLFWFKLCREHVCMKAYHMAGAA